MNQNFLDFRNEFEKKISTNFNFELLELNYLAYSFGSGMLAYMIKGKIVSLFYEGKDNILSVSISKPHLKYPTKELVEIFAGTKEEFLAVSLQNVINKITE